MTSLSKSAKNSFCKGFSFFKIVFFLMPLLGVLVPYALPLWLCLTSFLGLGILIGQNPEKREQIVDLLSHHFKKKNTTLLVTFLAAVIMFTFWMGLSTLWAPSPLKSLKLFGSLSALFLAGFTLCCLLQLFDNRHLRFLGFSFFLGCLLTFLFLTLEVYFGGSLRHYVKTGEYFTFYNTNGLMPYNQGATFLAVIVWPLLGLVYRWQRLLALPFLAIIFCLVLQLESHAAVAGLLVGGFVFLGVYSLRKPALILGSALTFIVMITSPQIIVTFLDPVKVEAALPNQAKASYSHRLWIWRYVSHRAFEKSLTGWGLDASRDKELKQSMLWHSERFCLEEGQKGEVQSCANESIPLHPHNMALQIWLELGVIGSILAALVISIFPLLIAYWPLSRFGKALAASTYASSLVIGFVAYGIWQNWWVSTLLIGISLTGWLLKFEKNTV